MKSELESFKSQGIGNDGDRGEGHGGSRDSGVQNNSKERIENAGRNRDTDDVVEESPEEVLLYCSHGLFAELDRLLDFTKISVEQGNAC
ncbi:MAG: hypothetical protein UW68_C0034G0011, partial [Candidatus Collierbacteria bacterium GW2011_GWB1_44_6]